MKKELLIWDFDGVIADTEKLWLTNRQSLLKSYMNIDWDFKTVEKHLKGMSDYTKREKLDSLGIITDDKFWDISYQMDQETMKTIGFELTPDIEEIFKLNIKQCIATGGLSGKTKQKIDIVGINNYFSPDKVFTADMVQRGKPEPDLFLLAAKTMGVDPSKCVVIEDSIAGLKAAIKAGATPIAFTKTDIDQVKELGVKYVFDNMIDIKKLILELF